MCFQFYTAKNEKNEFGIIAALPAFPQGVLSRCKATKQCVTIDDCNLKRLSFYQQKE